jgi:hypothetical protein
MRQKLNADARYERELAAVKRGKGDEYVTLIAADAGDWTREIKAQTAQAVNISGIWYPTSALRAVRVGYNGFLPWSSVRIGDELQVAAWVLKKD